MISVRWVRLACVIVVAISAMRVPAASGASAVEELAKRMPDDVVAFMGTSGEEALRKDFEKTILGRIWNDPNVQSLYQSIESQILTKIQQDVDDPNEIESLAMGADMARLVAGRPMIFGVVPLKGSAQIEEKPPVYVFAVLDAGTHKAELEAMVRKLESLAGAGEVEDVNVGSARMRRPKGDLPVSLYWGWSGKYLVAAFGDDEGAAMRYVQKPRAAVPEYLGKVPTAGDVVVAHVDVRRITGFIDTFIRRVKDAETADLIAAVLKESGLSGVGTVTWRAGFAGPNVVIGAYVKTATPRTGLLAALKPVDPAAIDMVDERAVTANVVNLDAAGVYDTILRTVKAASPEAHARVEGGVAAVESEIKVSIRKDLLESLAGPAIFYTLGAGTIPEAPFGGMVALIQLKDARLFEKTMAGLGREATARSNGGLLASSKKRDDGRMVHSWVVPQLSMMQIMPTWSVTNGYAVIGSNPAAYDLAAGRLLSTGEGRKSIRETARYREVASRLPDGLLNLSYADSQTQYTQAMTVIRQFWPMASMFVVQAGLSLPPAAPSLDYIIRDMKPSCEFCWAGPDGLYVQYQGPGIEASLSSVAAVSFGMGIMMPALARTRQLAFRMTSETNLSSVGTALFIYTDDHDGKLPPDLQTLVREANLSPKSLESKLKPKDFDDPSYIYIPGQDMSMYPGNIVAYDNPAFCVEGVNVLFLDTHVEFMKPAEFRDELEATYTRLKRPVPEIRFKGGEDAPPAAPRRTGVSDA